VLERERLDRAPVRYDHRMRTNAAIATLFGLLTCAHQASAHIELTYPPARFEYTDTGQKTRPCGSGTPTGAVTELAPGQSVTVTWNETVDHPGHFRISFDPDGGDDGLVDPAGYDDSYSADTVLVDDIEDTGGSTFSQEITLPNVTCERCTLQLIQVMTDKPPWGPSGGNDIYYWCADVSLVDGGGSGGASAGSGGAGTGGGSAGGAGGAGSGDGDRAFDSEGDDGCSIGPAGGSSEGRSASTAAAALGLTLFVLARRRLERRRSTPRR
jgi:hypothetical protein